MKIEILVTLFNEESLEDFLQAHAKEITVIKSNGVDLTLSVDEDYFLDTLEKDSRVKYVYEQTIPCSVYPTYPNKQFQQGSFLVGGAAIGNTRLGGSIRPGYPNDIPSNQEKNYLGTHFLNWGLWTNSDAAGPNRLQSLSSTRLPVGNHVDDTGGTFQKGHNANPLSSEHKKYIARFFGKDVDIITLEGGKHPKDIVSTYNANPEENVILNQFHSIYHPDFLEMPESDGGTVLQNRTTTNAAFPDGWYNTAESRIKLRDWAGKNNLLSTYNDTSKSEIERNALMSHCMGTASVSIGLMGGFAKKAHFYPYYADSGRSLLLSINEIISWHKSKKDRNPNIKYGSGRDLSQGVRNPTVLVLEIQFQEQKQNFFKVEDISSLVHKGKTVNRPAGGWGTNLQPFVDMHQIPFRIEDPDSDNTFHWAIGVGRGPLHGQKKVVKKLEEAWDAGIFVIVPAGNGCEVFARSDDAEFNSYFTVDSGTSYFQAQYSTGLGATITSYKAKSYSNDKVYPFRSQGPTGQKRNKALNIAAGQCSETHPILDPYTSRGPGIDLVGDGAGIFSAYAKFRYPVDTRLGSNLDLNPSSSQYDSDAYPFEIGQFVRIENMGSGGESAWNLYTRGTTVGIRGIFKVGSIVQIPSTHPANIPSGAKVTDVGWSYGYYGGTSCAAPTIAGKAACVMEEYLHTHKRWPTPIEVKNILLGSAKVVDAEAPSTFWKEVEVPPNFGRGMNAEAPNGTRYLTNSRHCRNWGHKNPYTLGATTFATSAGLLKPDVRGWKPFNQASSTIENSSIGSITSGAASRYTVVNVKVQNLGRADQYSYVLFNRGTLVPFIDGDPIVITGATGMTQINGQVYYVKRGNSNRFTLYTDQALTNLLDVSSFGTYDTNSGKVGYSTTITAASNYLTVGGSELVVNPGDQITLSGSNSDTNNGTYTITSVNNDVTPKVYTCGSNFIPMSAQAVPHTPAASISGTFSILQAKVNPTTIQDGVTVKLENVNGQPPAGIESGIYLEYDHIYEIAVESDNALNIKLTNMAESHTYKNLNEVIVAGTITAGKAFTQVKHVGIDKNGNFSSRVFWNQLKTASFDFDRNGTADALTDGLLLLRYLFELRGEALTLGAMAEDSPLTSEEVEQILKESKIIQDIDGDGRVDALTDGLLLLRYLFQLRGDALISGAVSEGANRTTAQEIEEFIEALLPESNATTHGYRDSANSGVPHAALFSLQNVSSERIEDNIPAGIQFNQKYFVEAGDEKLDNYTSPVSAEMFDWKKYFKNRLFVERGPYQSYGKCGWSWLKENGGKWNQTKMGSISIPGESTLATFTTDGTTYTIRDLWWSQGQDDWHAPDAPQTDEYLNPRTANGILCFSLVNRTNTDQAVPNTNATFGSLDVAGKSFSRADAFYKAGEPNPLGIMTPSIWWWHISTFPEQGSDFQTLGTGATYFSLNTAAQKRNSFKIKATASGSGNAVDVATGRVTNYKLKISNMDTSNSATIKSVSISNVRTEDYDQLCTAFDPRNSSQGEAYSFQSFAMTDLAGTPPLRAVYKGLGHENSETSKFIQGFSKTNSSDHSTQGAIYPDFDANIAATNDVTPLDINQDVTQYGWGRTADDVAIAVDTQEDSEEGTADSFDFKLKPGQERTEYEHNHLLEEIGSITITGSLSAPAVPANGQFEVGPVNTSIVPTGLPITFQWQKSTDNSTWTDISATDTVYNQAQTNQLSVLGYTGQSPVGEYYRCKVFQSGILDPEILFTNSVQAVSG